MGEKENAFLSEQLRSYYAEHIVPGVPEIHEREFGIGDFGKKIVKRHMAFSGEKELNQFLRSEAPPFISYSAAYYARPSFRPMEGKGLEGADLIYEFDADDIDTECKEEHDEWQCRKCGSSGKGAPKACSKCGAGVEVKQWFCSKCLQAAKEQTFKLIEVLSAELGFRDGISINFSGKAGFHVHVRSEATKNLSREARNELIDYLTLNGFDFEAHGFGQIISSGPSKKSAILSCPIPSKSKGVTKRFMDRLVSFIENWNAEKLAVHGNLKRKESKFLLENKDRLLEKMEQGILFPVNAVKPETSGKFWRLLLEEALAEESINLNIDRQTSVDIHKILRVPDSIHGGTGLIAKSISLAELKGFDPFKDAVAFSGGAIRVFINKAPKFSIGGNSFGPFESVETELPLEAAVLMIASGRAEIR